jgi:hypothetical protein
MNESLKILTFDELVTKKAAQDRKNDVFKKQMMRERSRAEARDLAMSQVSSVTWSYISRRFYSIFFPYESRISSLGNCIIK